MTLFSDQGVKGVYIFGSSARGAKSRDIDVLIVYDKSRCPPQSAHSCADVVVKCLQRSLCSPIHLVLLSEDEEKQVRFIRNERCIDIWKWMANKRVELIVNPRTVSR